MRHAFVSLCELKSLIFVVSAQSLAAGLLAQVTVHTTACQMSPEAPDHTRGNKFKTAEIHMRIVSIKSMFAL